MKIVSGYSYALPFPLFIFSISSSHFSSPNRISPENIRTMVYATNQLATKIYINIPYFT